jgi:hypothetical protein
MEQKKFRCDSISVNAQQGIAIFNEIQSKEGPENKKVTTIMVRFSENPSSATQYKVGKVYPVTIGEELQ